MSNDILGPETALPSGSGELESSLTPEQVKRLQWWTKPRHKAIKRAWRGVCSPRVAIKLQCLECCGEYQDAITGCTAMTCPLWKFRPFQTLSKKETQ